MDIDSAPIRKLNFDTEAPAANTSVSSSPSKKRQHVSSQPTNIEVFLRIRPTSPDRQCTATYSIANDQQSITLTAPNNTDIRDYSFNHIFDSATTNPQVYDRIGRKTIDRFLAGYTNLIFTYGITGSGKTHTITGNGNAMNGLLPSILHGLFHHDSIRNSNKYSIFASYLENYTKELYDLLKDEPSTTHNKENMNMRNHHAYNTNKRSNNTNKVALRVLSDGVDILDAATIQIRNAQEAILLIQSGNARRSKAHTKLNRNSSRSHVLFILDLFDGDQLKSRLCLVDLAGSESTKKNEFTVNDIGFNEACEINTQLSCLGRCMQSMQNTKNNTTKPPWREVMLTKLLWAYLRGKGYVNMIVTAHITNDDYNETMRALEFAATTQNIKMQAVVNSARPSTRHKSRITKTPRKTESKSSSVSATPSRNVSRECSVEINFINTCSQDQLRRIAIESYKTAVRAREMVKRLRNDKIAMIDKILKNKGKGLMKAIVEESAMDVDDDEDGDLVHKCNKEWEMKCNAMKMKHEEELRTKQSAYEGLSRKMAEHMMSMEEATLKYKYEMNELNKAHGNQMMQQRMTMQEMESKYTQEMENAVRGLQLTISDLQHELKGKGLTMKQLEDKLDDLEVEKISLQSDYNSLRETIQNLERERREQQVEGLERDKETEYNEKERKWNGEMEEMRNKQKQLLIENHKLETTNARYKVIMDESEQKIERFAHLNRECKSKIQKQHINIGELGEKNSKLTQMMNALKTEYKEKCDEFDTNKGEIYKALDQRKRINEDAQKEIVSLNQRLMQKQNELKEKHKYKAQFDELTSEFIQRGEELKNKKNMLTALTKQMTNHNLVYEQKMSALNKDIVHQKQMFQDDIQSKSETIKQLKEDIKTMNVEYEGKVNEIRNECDAKCMQNTQRMEQIQDKLKSAMSENDSLMQKMQENHNWSDKYQKLFATFTQHSDQNLILKKKYDEQSQQLVVFEEQIRDLAQCKEDLIGNVNRMRDEMQNGFKITCDELVTRHTEVMRNQCIQMQNLQNEYAQSQQTHEEMMHNKDTQIAEWQSKYIGNDAGYHQLKSGYDALENKYNEVMTARDTMESEWIETHDTMQDALEEKQNEVEMIRHELHDLRHKESELSALKEEMTKQTEFHRIALQEVDQEYLKEQQESKELYELNVELEDKSKAMQQQIEEMIGDTQRLQQEITALKANENRLIANHSNELNELQQRLSKQIENQCEERYQIQLSEQTGSLKKQLKLLEEQLKQLELQSLPSSRRESALTISDIGERRRSNRKRSREQMESDEEHAHPNKRRKITTEHVQRTSAMEQDDDNDAEDEEEEDDTNIFEELNKNRTQSCSLIKSDSSSLQPQNLLTEYNASPCTTATTHNGEPLTVTNSIELTSSEDEEEEEVEEDDDDVEIMQSDDSHIESNKEETVRDIIDITETPVKAKAKSKIVVTPALSHLSEGDTPLPKSSTSSSSKMRKAIQRNIKPKITYNKSTPNKAPKAKHQRYLAMRTPATNVKSKRRHTTQPFDMNAPTPTTKTALTKLRVVDLRQKLKKHKLKSSGLKNDLVQTLFEHKNANKENECDNDSSSEMSDSPELDTEWIGRCIKKAKGNKYYNGIRINGVEYNVGSEVFVLNETDKDWLAQIVELFEDDCGGCFMNNVWYWGHNEIAKAIKIKPYAAWKAAPNEVFLSSGHALDNNHISLINLEKRFRVFDSKQEMRLNCRSTKKELCDTYFCKYIFNLKGHKLIAKEEENRMEDIEEEEDDDNSDKEKSKSIRQRPKRHKRKTTSSKHDEKPPRKYPKRNKRKSTK